jgi:hypothetical protein
MQAEIRQLRAVETVPVAGTLDRTSGELRRLASVADSIQHIVSELLPEHRTSDITSLIELQRLDYLRQSIAGIADFLGALAATVPPHWSLDAKAASEAVTLSELALRLASMSEPAPGAHASPAGDCELFDARMAG